MAVIKEYAKNALLDRSVWVGECGRETGVAVSAAELDELSGYWDELPLDMYLSDNGKYRRRRFAELMYDHATRSLSNTGNARFYQPAEYNGVNTGVRTYTGIKHAFLGHQAVQAILLHFANKFCDALKVGRLEMSLHQVRVTGNDDVAGQPTPEGIHKDGVDYSCQILFRRDNVAGGESLIFDNDRQLQLGVTVMEPLEFYSFRDTEIYHAVSPVRPASAGKPAVRDILGIDFSIKRGRAQIGDD